MFGNNGFALSKVRMITCKDGGGENRVEHGFDCSTKILPWEGIVLARFVWRATFLFVKHALVTGGSGFLGKAIVKRLLAQGWAVSSLGRSPQSELKSLGVNVLQGDLASAEDALHACQGMDAVFHVAAKAGVWGPWDAYFETNVVGTRNIVDACKKCGVPRLVYTSTPSVVFNGGALNGADESMPYGSNWLCHYAHTKAIAEKIALDADTPGGLRVTALRPHLIWGVGDPHLIPRVLTRARAGKLRIVGSGDTRVDITHVDNAADAHLLALKALEGESVAGGKPYFITQGEPVNLWNWLNTLLERVGIPPITKKISYSTAYRVGAVLEGAYRLLRLSGEPRMTRFVAVELAKNHTFSIDAARRDLGYEPKISTESGLDTLVGQIKETGSA